MEKQLQGKVALVTGAAIGNGQAFCVRLAEEGAKIVIADIADATATKQLVEKVGGEVLTTIVDVTSEADTQRMVDETIQKFGRVDILVNNAGLYHEEPFELISYDDWKKIMDVNLNGLFLATQAVIPHMKKQQFGRIINLSSDTVWLGTPYLVHYVTSKMGVIGFTRSLAGEVGRYGITVNAITVGLTATQRPANQKLISSILEHLLPQQSVHRPEEPKDIADVVAFLASPGSSIITGQTINVDGGVARH
ncbi:MAG TPA: 3-oxoacyl-ACP reductase family protein [Candidatus Kapabacteria bacterium]|nr:3-oxoacyl-ACP reductase family protein [Candidatus Kapabacteria bacterium]